MALRCLVVTPDRTFFDDEADSVVVPGWNGEIGFYPQHAPLIAKLGHGVLRVVLAGGKVERFAIFGGFVMVREDQVTVLAGGAEKASDIDRDKATRELAEARKAQLERRSPYVTAGQAAESEEALGRARARVAAVLTPR